MIARVLGAWLLMIAAVLVVAFVLPPPPLEEHMEAPDATTPAPAPTPSRQRDPAPPTYADDEPALVTR